MVLRLGSFNVENLFKRAKALNTATWSEGEPVLIAFERFNALANRSVYTDTDKQAMLAALETLQVLVRTRAGSLRLNTEPFDAWALLRENRGDFLVQPASGDARIVASGRGDWIGWAELLTEIVDETAIRMTARVMDELAADVLGIVEAEDRPALVRMNGELLGGRYGHAMLIDGNDLRGIDVGLLCNADIELVSVRSNVDVPDPAAPTPRPLFSRDSPVYQLRLPGGDDLWVLVNHLKSQSFSSGDPDPLRSRQSAEVRRIYDRLSDQGAELVAVIGDFNRGPTNDQPPQHPTLEPLLGPDSPLVDATTLPGFDLGPRPGTFQSCSLRNRLDYILLSEELAGTVTGGGIFRKGLWGDPGNVNPPQAWEIYPEITASVHAASDHAAIWVDLDL
jgi:endonuclease/exonuclease/phosphatase family metal-dependent hydrolase